MVEDSGERPLHAIVVDDKSALLKLRQGQLDLFGIIAEVFTAPADALTRIEEALQDPRSCDLVMTDFDMPGMTGEIFAQRVKILSGKRPVPIILVTGRSLWEVQKLLDQGLFDASLHKPFGIGQLKAVIEQVTGRELTTG